MRCSSQPGIFSWRIGEHWSQSLPSSSTLPFLHPPYTQHSGRHHPYPPWLLDLRCAEFILFVFQHFSFGESESQSVMSDSLQPNRLTVDGILKARILEWVAYPFSRGSSRPGNQTSACCIAGGFFTNWIDWESHPILVRRCYPAWNLNIELNLISAGQEATVRTGHGTTDWFKIRKGVHQGCILSPCLFNLYADYIMRNAGLEEAQVGIKIAGKNIDKLRYADDTTLMAESEEELKSLFFFFSVLQLYFI